MKVVHRTTRLTPVHVPAQRPAATIHQVAHHPPLFRRQPSALCKALAILAENRIDAQRLFRRYPMTHVRLGFQGVHSTSLAFALPDLSLFTTCFTLELASGLRSTATAERRTPAPASKTHLTYQPPSLVE